MSDQEPSALTSEEVHAYCREVEAYLCRRNDGHLIRVVGPAFELVKGWATQGIPLALVREAIDRVVARAEKKAARRRPVRLEFCDAEVLDGYDRWRRAVGVASPVGTGSGPKRGSLHAHVERVAAQLAVILGSDRAPEDLRPAVAAALTALDAVHAASPTARGAARDALLATLAEIDGTLLDHATRALPPGRLANLAAEAAAELAAYRPRLPAAQWDTAVAAARGRLVRIALGLPSVRFE